MKLLAGDKSSCNHSSGHQTTNAVSIQPIDKKFLKHKMAKL
jgi:hypothetical protein